MVRFLARVVSSAASAGAVSSIRELTGRRFAVLPVPGRLIRAIERLTEVLIRLTPMDSRLMRGATVYMTQGVPSDDRRITEELGVVLRDPKETLADSLRGFYEAGMLTAREVGKLADRERPPEGRPQ